MSSSNLFMFLPLPLCRGNELSLHKYVMLAFCFGTHVSSVNLFFMVAIGRKRIHVKTCKRERKNTVRFVCKFLSVLMNLLET